MRISELEVKAMTTPTGTRLMLTLPAERMGDLFTTSDFLDRGEVEELRSVCDEFLEGRTV